MTASITNVVLAGAIGNLGPSILEQLLLAGEFTVTVLIRKESPRTFPAPVKTITVDYDSLDSLTSALSGQDAVVSTLPMSPPKKLLLIEAAAKAGVKRFLPTEFGPDTRNPKVRQLPIFQTNFRAQDLLEEKTKESALTYTLVANGGFFDWGLKINWLVNAKDRHAVLYDGGDRKISFSLLSDVGKAVVGVLRHPEETKNRLVFVHSTVQSFKDVYEIAKKLTPGEKWTDEVVQVEDVLSSAWAEIKKENPDPANFAVKFITAVIAGEGYGSLFEKTDNELLGIKELTREEVEEVIKRYL
ncbi:hypothetical protein QBC40DRAFT_330464 [Triangularia verruculosa]|uniref:NAD(P)-binding domain-containing protein n=1 Tax=Triangularia verruculosa TaxID=2587418 RepID=A0AAN6XDX4_9PEZI|nr:hypothetical protein QBC40DRAFT_330464 [Triangularia verruculosa]